MDFENKDDDNKDIKKHVLIESELHAPFKSYCVSVENKPVKTVVSNMIREKLSDSGFQVVTKNNNNQGGGSND